MKVAVDANILFSCLIKGGLTRKIWLSPVLVLYSPAFILQELEKYRPLLLKKYGGPEEEFIILMDKLLRVVRFVPDSELVAFIPAASTLMADKKDIFYLACALKEGTVLWSNDKGFKHQKRVPAFTTEEMARESGHLQ